MDNTKTLKDKVVEFSLSEVMRLPDLTKKGYQRHEVIALFTELQNKAMGIYTEGTQGKGKCATFEFCMAYPEKYCMTFKVEKLHSDYAGKPAINTNEPSKRKVSEETKLNCSLRTSLTANQYKILVENNCLKVSIVDNGSVTIEAALSKVWDSVKDVINEPKYQHMTALERVSSQLMGHGFYNY